MGKKESKEVAQAGPSRVPSTFGEMEHWFDNVFKRELSLFGQPWWPRSRFSEMGDASPSVDIFREGNDIVVKAEVPGMDKKDLDVVITEDKITVSGEKKKEEKVEKKDYYRFERSEGSFARSFRLPENVQTDKAKATFKKGVLEVRIPVSTEARKKEKKLEIS